MVDKDGFTVEHAFFYGAGEGLGEEIDGALLTISLADATSADEAGVISAAVLMGGEERVEVEGEFVFGQGGLRRMDNEERVLRTFVLRT